MVVTTFTDEHNSPITPARLFKASIVDSYNLIPKLMPQAIKSIEIIHGNGGTGSIKQINLAEGNHFKSLKYHIDELDVLRMYKIVETYLLENPNAYA